VRERIGSDVYIYADLAVFRFSQDVQLIDNNTMGRGKELSPQTRSRICELRSLGWTPSRIHKKHPEIPLGTIKSTIRRKAFRNDNTTLPRSGAPRKLTQEDRDRISSIVAQNPQIKHKDLLREIGNKVKERTLRYLLRELGRRN
jgi:hypothetical protein